MLCCGGMVVLCDLLKEVVAVAVRKHACEVAGVVCLFLLVLDGCGCVRVADEYDVVLWVFPLLCVAGWVVGGCCHVVDGLVYRGRVKKALHDFSALREQEKELLRAMVVQNSCRSFEYADYISFALLIDAGFLEVSYCGDDVRQGKRLMEFQMTKVCRDVLYRYGVAEELLRDLHG